jgi:hypothetical protein
MLLWPCFSLPVDVHSWQQKLTASDLAWSLRFVLVWVQHDFSYLKGMAD